MEFQFACSYGNGGRRRGGGCAIEQRYKATNISFDSNVSITGVHDTKISFKKYFFGIYFFLGKMEETSSSPRKETLKINCEDIKIPTNYSGKFSFKVKAFCLG